MKQAKAAAIGNFKAPSFGAAATISGDGVSPAQAQPQADRRRAKQPQLVTRCGTLQWILLQTAIDYFLNQRIETLHDRRCVVAWWRCGAG